jgi:hypothetical protein
MRQVVKHMVRIKFSLQTFTARKNSHLKPCRQLDETFDMDQYRSIKLQLRTREREREERIITGEHTESVRAMEAADRDKTAHSNA